MGSPSIGRNSPSRIYISSLDISASSAAAAATSSSEDATSPITTNAVPPIFNPKSNLDIAKFYLGSCQWQELAKCLHDTKLPRRDIFTIHFLVGTGNEKEAYAFILSYLKDNKVKAKKEFDVQLYLHQLRTRLVKGERTGNYLLNVPTDIHEATLWLIDFIVLHQEGFDTSHLHLFPIINDQISLSWKLLLNHPQCVESILLFLLETGEVDLGRELTQRGISANPTHLVLNLYGAIFNMLSGHVEEARKILLACPTPFKPIEVSLLLGLCDLKIEEMLFAPLLVAFCFRPMLPEKIILHFANHLLATGTSEPVHIDVLQKVLGDCLRVAPDSKPLHMLIGRVKNAYKEKIDRMGKLSWVEHYLKAEEKVFESNEVVKDLFDELRKQQRVSEIKVLLYRGFKNNLLQPSGCSMLCNLYFQSNQIDKAKEVALKIYEAYRITPSTPLIDVVEHLFLMTSIEISLVLILQNLANKSSEIKKCRENIELFSKILINKIKKMVDQDQIIEWTGKALCLKIYFMIVNKEYEAASDKLREFLFITHDNTSFSLLNFYCLFEQKKYDDACVVMNKYDYFDSCNNDLITMRRRILLTFFCDYNLKNWQALVSRLLKHAEVIKEEDSLQTIALRTMTELTLLSIEKNEPLQESSLLLKEKIDQILDHIPNSKLEKLIFLALLDFQNKPGKITLRALKQFISLDSNSSPLLERCQKLVSAPKSIATSTLASELSHILDDNGAIAPYKQTTSAVSREKAAHIDQNEHDEDLDQLLLDKSLEEAQILRSNNARKTPLPDITRYSFRADLEAMQRKERVHALKQERKEISAAKGSETLPKDSTLASAPLTEGDKFLINAARGVIPELQASLLCEAPDQRKLNEIYYNLFKIFETLKRVPFLTQDFNPLRNELRHNFTLSLPELLEYAKELLQDDALERYLAGFIENGKKSAVKIILPQFKVRIPLAKSEFIELLRHELNHFDLWIIKVGGDIDVMRLDTGLHKMLKGIHQRMGQILRELKDRFNVRFSPEINQIITNSNYDAHSDAADIDVFPPEACLAFLRGAKNKLFFLFEELPAASAAAAAASKSSNRRKKK